MDNGSGDPASDVLIVAERVVHLALLARVFMEGVCLGGFQYDKMCLVSLITQLP